MKLSEEIRRWIDEGFFKLAVKEHRYAIQLEKWADEAAALEAELETCKGYLADAPDHSDLDAAAFQINVLEAKNYKMEEALKAVGEWLQEPADAWPSEIDATEAWKLSLLVKEALAGGDGSLMDANEQVHKRPAEAGEE